MIKPLCGAAEFYFFIMVLCLLTDVAFIQLCSLSEEHVVCAKVSKESESTASHQGLMDGQVPGSVQDEATVYRQINKSEADADRPQSPQSDRQTGAKGRRLQVGPSQRCKVLVIKCQSPSVWWAEALSQGEALIIVTATVALTLASANNA